MYLKSFHIEKAYHKKIISKKGVFDSISTKIKFYFAMAGNTNELGPYQLWHEPPKIIIQFIFPFFDDRSHSGCPNVILRQKGYFKEKCFWSNKYQDKVLFGHGW